LSVIGRLIFGRWFARWLLRGGPWAIAGKLAAVGIWGAFKWRRETRRLAREVERREIEAEYEVLPGTSAPGAGTDSRKLAAEAPETAADNQYPQRRTDSA
jgi:hypothetical protein